MPEGERRTQEANQLLGLEISGSKARQATSPQSATSAWRRLTVASLALLARGIRGERGAPGRQQGVVRRLGRPAPLCRLGRPHGSYSRQCYSQASLGLASS